MNAARRPVCARRLARRAALFFAAWLWALGLFDLASGASISLPLPIFFEDFNNIAEGGLPEGWQGTNYSTVSLTTSSFQDLASTPYAGWLVVESSRFRTNFVGYKNHSPVDYSRVLSFNPDNLVNGRVVTNLAEGKMLFANSGYREGNQVMFLFTPDYDLSGHTNVYGAFHSLYEQNQDSIAVLEYSIDRGTNWLPVLYCIDAADVASTGGVVDAVKTLTNRFPDVATFTVPGKPGTQGGYYGAFAAAPISQALAPYISGRIDDNPVESKRVEVLRLPAADNQPTVRFRFVYAGTDSWYWGIDDFGLYSITPGQLPVVVAAPVDIDATPGLSAKFTTSATGAEPLSYQWKLNGVNLPGATNATLVLPSVSVVDEGVYTVVISNPHGAVETGGARLTVSEPRVTGQWDFDHGDLSATVGADLEFFGNPDGVLSFSTLEMHGQVAHVLAFGAFSPSQGLYMRHGALPNAGGQFVNRYTLLMDILHPPESGDHWRALLQTDPLNHPGNDAEFLVADHTAMPDAGGIGAEGIYQGSLSSGAWHRVALAVDLAAPERQLTKYIDGVKVGDQALPGGIDGRYALGPAALLFTSGLASPSRAQPGLVNSIQFIDSCLSAEAVAALGPATAKGLPPGNAAIALIEAQVDSGLLHLRWTGPAGLFDVERKKAFADAEWRTSAGPTSNRSVVLPLEGETAFYRIRQSRADLVVGQLPGSRQSLPSKQVVRPAGEQAQFAGRPVDLALSPDKTVAFIKNINSLLVVDIATWQVRQTLAYPANGGASMHGIAVRPDGRRVYVTSAGNQLYEWNVDAAGLVGFARTIALPAGTYPCGVALNKAGDKAFVCLSIANTLGIVNLTTGQLETQVRVGVAPWDVALSPDETVAYVSDWGGRFPGAGDLTAPSAGTPVVIDDRGVGASGVVSFVNLVAKREEAQAPTGLHPCDLELTADGSTLYVANANSDTVTVIDTASRAVRETILVRPDPSFPYGSASTGLALSSDEKTLYVTSAGNNAIAVVKLGTAGGRSELRGFLPTDWYPGAIAADTTNLYVVNVKGLGSRFGQPTAKSYQIGAHLGTANRIPLPSEETLNKFTAQAFDDGRGPHVKRSITRVSTPRPEPVPVPERLGDPSVFKHVLYILKENKTYDQMFGDISEGNGDPNLCIYPEFVSPNHHALARDYVLLDNFYCNGVNSSDGHSWSTEANVTDHLEKAFGGFSRSYTFGDDPLTYSSSGFIWNNVLRHGLTFRNYGEMDYASPVPNTATWLQIYTDFTNGTRSIRYSQNIGLASLRPYSSTNVPGWNLGIPDVVRAEGFLREFRAAEARGTWENFHLLYLSNDHTGGPPSPRAQVADNDLALGQVVEAVTSSRFGSNTVIFVIEDDPQSGYDHIDAHRSICLVISPYTKRGRVISAFYNQAGVLHTMERILGLPPMNQQDAMAPLMFDCFTNVPNFTPYRARTNNIPLAEGAAGKAMLSPQDRYWAEKIQELDFSRPDRINDDLFNRYIWHTVKGDAPYPAEFVGGHGKGLGRLGLRLDGADGDGDEDEHGDGPR